jgi:mono/diheme cytochrome c family protein
MADSSKRCCTMAVLALALVATGVAGVTALLLRGGISARPDPSRLEAAVARRLRHWEVPAQARDLRNPVRLSPEVLADARGHFANHCASCHANDGSGDTTLGRSLYPRAPDMRQPETQALADGELFYIIENGVRLTGMPAWGQPGRESESWKLVHFIRRLPALSAEEKLEMERLNPRGPEEWKELEDEERFLDEGAEPKAPPAGPAGAHHRH